MRTKGGEGHKGKENEGEGMGERGGRKRKEERSKEQVGVGGKVRFGKCLG